MSSIDQSHSFQAVDMPTVPAVRRANPGKVLRGWSRGTLHQDTATLGRCRSLAPDTLLTLNQAPEHGEHVA